MYLDSWDYISNWITCAFLAVLWSTGYIHNVSVLHCVVQKAF